MAHPKAMQLPRVVVACVLLACAAVARGSVFASAGHAVVSRASTSPVTRIVELLKGLSESVEQEGKAEEDLYETFVCWAKSVISQKTQANTAAQSRVDALTTYIDDLQAGRIELTTERQDLEKEIAAVTGAIEQATAIRDKESKDFLTAQAEMQQAIAALEQAIDVLKEGTKAGAGSPSPAGGALLATRNSLGEGFAARSREAETLHRALEIGQKVLTKGDAVFLRRLLTGEVPEEKDWKKLNGKATFKEKYEARSTKIQQVLTNLLQDFKSNLDEATKKEEDAKSVFDKLMEAKNGQLTSAQDALASMLKEGGARGLSLEDANAEKDALTEQITSDTGYIADTQKALDTKKEEWKTRKQVRVNEQAAISKAIEILTGDDAKDLFKRSFASQGYLFLQVSRSSARAADAAAALRRAAAAAGGDLRLTALATLASTGRFDEVLTAIDKMLESLKAQEETELKTKEQCEKDRAADTRSAAQTSRTIDEVSDAITALEAKIQELTAELEEKGKRVTEIDGELATAKEMRDKENAEYLKAKADDEAAAELIANAKTVISEYYASSGALIQKRGHLKGGKQPFTTKAGEAPPPPPSTWDAPYAGKKDESTGILSILELVHDDVLADIAAADKAEQDAVIAYDKLKAELEQEQKDLQSAIVELEKQKSTAMDDVETNKSDRTAKTGELEAVLQRIAATAPGCDFFTVNYAVRTKNRQVEIDGLTTAKTILKTYEAQSSGGGGALLQGPPQQAARRMLRRRGA